MIYALRARCYFEKNSPECAGSAALAIGSGCLTGLSWPVGGQAIKLGWDRIGIGKRERAVLRSLLRANGCPGSEIGRTKDVIGVARG
jgi:hypothetical protein